MIPSPKPWTYVQAPAFGAVAKAFAKSNPAELTGCLQNLRRYLDILSGGQVPGTFKMGFMHLEPAGMVALDQGRNKKLGRLSEARLYTWADRATHTVVLLYIGGKSGQNVDLQTAAAILHGWRSGQKGDPS